MQLREPHSLLVFWGRTRSVALVGLDLRALDRPEEASGPLNSALDRAERALRRRLADHGGVELRVDGDGMFGAAFDDPSSALRFALAARARLDKLSSDAMLEPVRIAAHLATLPRPIQPTLPQLNDELRVLGRLRDSALSASVLVSGPLYRAAASALPPDARVYELGQRRLVGVEGAREVVEIQLAQAQTALSEPPAEPPELTNLSANPSSFAGRERELRELDRLFGRGARLVTLLGPPGVGKSRLAARYAALNLFRFGGGVLKVDLPGFTTPSSLLLGLSELLGVATEGQLDLLRAAQQLGAALEARGTTLVLLDGVEHLDDEAGDLLGEWLLGCPSARFLVTSRERLRLDGEVVCELGPMNSEDAIALFLRRLSESRPTVELSPTEQLAVAELVERLDRLPLAIELAAARASAVSASSLLVQLSRVQGGRIALSEHGGARANTLQQALDLTWGSLSEGEQDALAQLSVFRGGFDLEAAEAVVDLSGHDPAPWLLDVIETLTDRSLLRVEPGGPTDAVRFHMLGLIRDFLARKLADTPRRAAVERRHRLWVLGRAEALAAEVDGPSSADALRKLAEERDNLEAAVSTGRRLPRDPEHVARALMALVPLFQQRLPLEALHGLFDAYLRESAELPPRWRVHGLIQRAEVSRLQGRLSAASADLDEAQRWMPQVESGALEASLQVQIARSQRAAGQLSGAMEALERALAAARGAGDRLMEARALYTMSTIGIARGEHKAAEAALQRCRVLYREVGAVRLLPPIEAALARLRAEQLRFDEAVAGMRAVLKAEPDLLTTAQRASFLRAFGAILVDLGRLTEGERTLKEALQLARRSGARTTEGAALQYLGVVHLERGRMAEGDVALSEAVAIADETRQPLTMAVARAQLGGLRQAQGRASEALELLSAALGPLEQARFTAVLRLVRGWLSVCLATLGRPDEARAMAALVRADGAPEETQDGYAAVLCAALTELLLAAEGPPRLEAAMRAKALLTQASVALDTPLGGRVPAPLARSAETRLAARTLERQIDRLLPGASLGLD